MISYQSATPGGQVGAENGGAATNRAERHAAVRSSTDRRGRARMTFIGQKAWSFVLSEASFG